MIHNRNMSSKEFKILRDYVVVKPIELDTGEVKTDTGLILATEQNTSIIDRPSTGYVIIVGKEVQDIKLDNLVIWVEQEGLDIELSDGHFILLREKSILGYKE